MKTVRIRLELPDRATKADINSALRALADMAGAHLRGNPKEGFILSPKRQP